MSSKVLNRFKEFLDVVRGKEDIRERFSFLFNPEELRTASNLTPLQAEFVEDAFFVTAYFPRFQPLKDLAIEILKTTPSIKGKRVEDAIQFQRASKGTQISQAGVFHQLKDKVTKKGKENEQ